MSWLEGDDAKEEIYSIKNYPYRRHEATNKRHIVTIGIGGNVGDVERRFQKLFEIFFGHKDIDIIKSAPIYKNPPFGYKDQDYFLNSILVVATNYSYRKFFSYLMYIERRLGRVRYFKNAPRKIDLDIIFYDKIRFKRDWLEIPHPRWSSRDSVLVPIFLLKE